MAPRLILARSFRAASTHGHHRVKRGSAPCLAPTAAALSPGSGAHPPAHHDRSSRAAFSPCAATEAPQVLATLVAAGLPPRSALSRRHRGPIDSPSPAAPVGARFPTHAMAASRCLPPRSGQAQRRPSEITPPPPF
uniref:Uncharacterized protein n=1 Tax=Setaria italica TaxID=4555 RepID=K4ANL1_SETIT